MPIPQGLYDFIIDQRKIFALEDEKCPFTAHQNCFSLDGSTGQRVKKDNVLVMQVKQPKLVKQVLFEAMQTLLEEWVGGIKV